MKRFFKSAMRAVLLFTAAAAILLLLGSSADFRGAVCVDHPL